MDADLEVNESTWMAAGARFLILWRMSLQVPKVQICKHTEEPVRPA